MQRIDRLGVRAAYVAAYLSALGAVAWLVAARGWMAGWSRLGVPPMPQFADMLPLRAAVAERMLGASEAARRGLTDPWNRPFNYPDVWLALGRAVPLTDPARYQLFIAAMIALLVLACAALLWWRPSVFMLVFVLSLPFMLAIERGNTEMLVFVLVLLAGSTPRAGLAAGCIALASLLKLLPLFASARLLSCRPALIACVGGCAAYWAAQHAAIARMQAGTPVSPSVSYGVASMQSALAVKTGVALPAWAMLVVTLLVAAGSFVALPRLRRDLARAPGFDAELRLFLAGAGVYVGSFLAASNFDYRLMFLAACIPHLARALAPWPRRAAYACILLAAHQQLLMQQLGRAPGGGLNVLAKLVLFAVLASALAELVCALTRDYAWGSDRPNQHTSPGRREA